VALNPDAAFACAGFTVDDVVGVVTDVVAFALVTLLLAVAVALAGLKLTLALEVDAGADELMAVLLFGFAVDVDPTAILEETDDEAELGPGATIPPGVPPIT